ncbi:uncharacterized protein LOC109133568 [Beta vulgaris subsp. vulgaris]|uniref:uncharacterized protein LOC109133568 n=1 Tax=Beta vulgaris subsp. vulgaris TaxID=3555 RepID=UPI00203694EA|nr:uncharacterized protein LOC109133568 [Beta vulgaris subsp. vulgaris]
METLASKEHEQGANSEDPYNQVIKKVEHSGRVRLYGKGVTKTDLKKGGTKCCYIIPQEFLQSIQTGLVEQLREANPGIDLVVPDVQVSSTTKDATATSNEAIEQNGEQELTSGTDLLNQVHEADKNVSHDQEQLQSHK